MKYTPLEWFLIIVLVYCHTTQAMEVINRTNTPKIVEILEYRPVPGGSFGQVILQAELQPGELRSFNCTHPEFVIEIKWGHRYEIPDDKFMLREADPSRVAQWQQIASAELAGFSARPYPVVTPPNTSIKDNSDGTISYVFPSGQQLQYDPLKDENLLSFLIRMIPFRLMNKIIVERVPSPIVIFSNRRVLRITLPAGHEKTAATTGHKDQIIIAESGENTITLHVQCLHR